MRVKTATYQRDLPLVKHVGLFGALRYRRTAQFDGFDDSIFTDTASFISEGAPWNVGFFNGGKVIWPNAEVLPGATMRLLKQIHEEPLRPPYICATSPRCVPPGQGTSLARPPTKIDNSVGRMGRRTASRRNGGPGCCEGAVQRGCRC